MKVRLGAEGTREQILRSGEGTIWLSGQPSDVRVEVCTGLSCSCRSSSFFQGNLIQLHKLMLHR